MERSVTFCRDQSGFQTDCTDCNPPALSGEFGRITLTYNVDSKEKVDEIIALVRNAGGIIVKEPQEVFWGGYHGYFADHS